LYLTPGFLLNLDAAALVDADPLYNPKFPEEEKAINRARRMIFEHSDMSVTTSEIK
jgi:hypothetical protein